MLFFCFICLLSNERPSIITILFFIQLRSRTVSRFLKLSSSPFENNFGWWTNKNTWSTGIDIYYLIGVSRRWRIRPNQFARGYTWWYTRQNTKHVFFYLFFVFQMKEKKRRTIAIEFVSMARVIFGCRTNFGGAIFRLVANAQCCVIHIKYWQWVSQSDYDLFTILCVYIVQSNIKPSNIMIAWVPTPMGWMDETNKCKVRKWKNKHKNGKMSGSHND